MIRYRCSNEHLYFFWGVIYKMKKSNLLIKKIIPILFLLIILIGGCFSAFVDLYNNEKIDYFTSDKCSEISKFCINGRFGG